MSLKLQNWIKRNKKGGVLMQMYGPDCKCRITI